MKLELKHLAPYLSYNIRMIFEKSGREIFLSGLFQNERGNMILMDYSVGEQFLYNHLNFKPILRPLSDLTKEIEHNGEMFVPIEKLFEECAKNKKPDYQDYYHDVSPNYIYCSHPSTAERLCISLYSIMENSAWIVNYLFEWHFDVFGLIENGLAIDINEIEKPIHK